MPPSLLFWIMGTTLFFATCKSPSDLNHSSQAFNTDSENNQTLSCTHPSSELNPDCPKSPSLFDEIFTSKESGTINIPNNFRDLTSSLQRKLNVDPVGVLIPTSRSLQKYESRLRYFQYPRVLVAIQSGNEQFLEDANQYYAKDMLYIAYSEPAEQLEVISFNPEQGRFEFQIVTDFHPTKKPRSFYVPRANCVRCHQNEAPIFPELEWDETNANGQMSLYLKRVHGLEYQGIKTVQSESSSYDDDKVLESFLYDESTDRASENILFWQKLWKACHADEDKLISCRKAVALSLLDSSFFPRDPLIAKEISKLSMGTKWGRLFKIGLEIESDADIPNLQVGSDAFLNDQQKSSLNQMKLKKVNPLDIFRFILLQNSILDRAENPANPRKLRKELWQLNEGEWTPTFQKREFHTFERRLPGDLSTRGVFDFRILRMMKEYCSTNPDNSLSCDNLTQKILKSSQEMTALLKKESFDTVGLLRILLDKKRVKNSVPFIMSPLLVAAKAKKLPNSTAGFSQLYQYCGSCHGMEEFSEGPAFLTEIDNPEVFEQIRPGICQRLDWENIDESLRMPPIAEKPYGLDKLNQYQRLKKSPQDLLKLKQDLKCR